MSKRILVLVLLVVGCGDNGPPVELSCPPRPSAVSEPLGTLDAIASVDCEFLLLAHVSGGSGTILELGTDGTLGQFATPVRPGRTYLDQLLAFSSTDVWAVNDTHPVGQPGSTDPSEVLHYDGAQWQAFSFYNSYLSRMWASSPSDVWIIRGDISNPNSHGPGAVIDLRRWNGTAFVAVDLPGGVDPGAGAGPAADDVWMCGDGSMLHFDGNGWTSYPNGVHDCVAVFSSHGWMFLLGSRSVSSWNGSTWSPIYSEADTTVTLSAMWGATRDDLWVGGAAGSRGYLLHFDGGAWSRVAVSGAAIRAIHGTSRDDVLFGGAAGYLAHWDGHAMTELAGARISMSERTDLGSAERARPGATGQVRTSSRQQRPSRAIMSSAAVGPAEPGS